MKRLLILQIYLMYYRYPVLQKNCVWSCHVLHEYSFIICGDDTLLFIILFWNFVWRRILSLYLSLSIAILTLITSFFVGYSAFLSLYSLTQVVLIIGEVVIDGWKSSTWELTSILSTVIVLSSVISIGKSNYYRN